MRLGCLFCLVFTLMYSLSPVTAQDTNQHLIPPYIDEATIVYIDVYINDILAIDEKMETFDVDGYLLAEWSDPRQVFDAFEFGYDFKIYRNEMVQDVITDEVWWPDLYLVNGRGNREIISSLLLISPDGDMRYEEKFKATIKQAFQLENFPFDSHQLVLTIGSFSYTDYEVIFTSYKDAEVFEWQTNEWIVTDSGELDFNSSYGYPVAQYFLGISRLPGFYISKYIFPLVLIITISWSVFWLGYESIDIADRLGIILTSVLTVVAFDFVSSETLPRLSYHTILDWIMILSYVVLSLTVLETLLGYRNLKHGLEDRANKIDLLSRYIFPLVYYVAIVSIIVYKVLL
jgi:hypothetical protein